MSNMHMTEQEFFDKCDVPSSPELLRALKMAYMDLQHYPREEWQKVAIRRMGEARYGSDRWTAWYNVASNF